jgi:two-component system, OmpR family, KDP operon response regulator KdpE
MSDVPVKIMIVDDEPKMRNLLRMGLSIQGYEVLESPNGDIAMDLLQQEPKLIILDRGLPDVPGHDLLRRIRERNDNVPIVVLSSRGDEAGKVEALDLGADDHLTKPFRINELLARVRTALRRQMRAQGERPVFRTGDLSVDLVRGRVSVGDRKIRLTPGEYYVLRILALHAGSVVTHDFLVGELWDQLADAEDLRVCVQRLRRKIETESARPRFILTVPGVGYQLRAPEAPDDRTGLRGSASRSLHDGERWRLTHGRSGRS